MRRSLCLPLCLLLTAALLAGCAAPAAAPEPTESPAEPAPTAARAEEAALTEDVEGLAFAAAMTDYEQQRIHQPPAGEDLSAAEAAGWYAAWLWRTQEVDLLTREQVDAVQRALGYDPARPWPLYWEETGNVRVLRAADGTESLDFAAHKQRLAETLGVTMELRLESAGTDTVRLTLIRHLSGDYTAQYPYELRFEPNDNPAGAFPRKLAELKRPELGPQTDPALTFTWEELVAANRLSALLELYPFLRVENEYAPDMPTWIFRRFGRLALLNGDGETYVGGQYRGCTFAWEADGAGVFRASVTAVDEDADFDEYQESYLTDRLSNIAVLKLDSIDGDLIRAVGVSEWDTPVTLTVERGSLALRELCYLTDSGESISTTRVSLGGEMPEFAFLDSWERSLRTVTIEWESYEGGSVQRWQTVTEVPEDWEYLPWECRWGDYTAWMNKGYTRPYFYPGDGMDYTLYLSTAKG